MKTTFTFIGIYFNRYWVFRFHRFKHVEGYILRICGIEMKRMEKDATQKLIKKFREKQKLSMLEG